MNQTLHILRKDFDQLWLQLMLPTSALLLATLLQIGVWTDTLPTDLPFTVVAYVLLLLLTMSWMVLILTLVQEERLVGLTQFWTTRPYEWPKLLAAKLFFVLLFLVGPLFLSQLFLLLCSGLPVVPALPALLLNLALVLAFLIIAPLAAAAVTRTMRQAVMVLLSFAFLVAAIALLAATVRKLAPPGLAPLQIVLGAAIFAAALVHQYRTRNTARSVRLLLVAPVVLLTLQLAVPGTPLAALAYPLASTSAAPLSIRFDSRAMRKNPTPVFAPPIVPRDNNQLIYVLQQRLKHLFAASGTRLYLHVPMLDSGIAPGAVFQVDAHRLILTSADGAYRWTSSWSTLSATIQPDPIQPEVTATSDFPIPLSVYQRLRDAPVRLGVEFALTQFQNQPPDASQLSTAGSSIPNLGICVLKPDYSALTCRSALYEPPRFFIQTVRQTDPCTTPSSTREPATAVLGGFDGIPLLPRIGSVSESDVRLDYSPRAGSLCPGLPIAYQERRFQRRLSVAMPETTIHLEDYIESVRIE